MKFETSNSLLDKVDRFMLAVDFIGECMVAGAGLLFVASMICLAIGALFGLIDLVLHW